MFTYPEIDPVAIALGPLKIHWYGIMYLLAFASALGLGLLRARKSWSPVKPKQMEDAVFYAAVGVVAGGRIGYVVFYNFADFVADPLWLFRLWEGGMSFHGGMLGVVVAMWLYTRKIKQPFLKMMDFAAPLVPAGLFFGRIGNFIGQELWGRPTDSAWGMIFPKDPEQLSRHPSQLYEAFLEGIVIFVVLWIYSRKPRPTAAVSSLFLILYGSFRFTVEFFREPDAHIQFDLFGWMTRGQILCVPMVIIGLIFFAGAYIKANRDGAAKVQDNRSNA
ncbi:prolipoprotein diacylglyceryl transferase [Agaribacterium haliotis]|uniref:prolipoprotein diacylglyceryl transferase n=1 Tax=Agaribacterium haliotis TaxID=2013869 RepID=UPI000BB54558|nr:prolipoprotein diacylglyceryl transferase [Agaribacterium haliotis]